MCGQQRVTGHVRSHLLRAQYVMREDREHHFAYGALQPPNGGTTQPDTGIMRVARQAPAAATSRLVCELKAKGQEKGEDEFDKRLAVAKELKVGRFIVK